MQAISFEIILLPTIKLFAFSYLWRLFRNFFLIRTPTKLMFFLDNWSVKAQRRRTTGTGRMKHLKIIQRRFKNGFREGVQAKSKKNRTAAPTPASTS